MAFDNTIELSAKALKEMFGADAVARAQEQASICLADGREESARFWADVAAELRKLAAAGRNKLN